MQTKLVTLDPGDVVIYFLGDIHEGSANHQAKALEKAVKIIAEENAYWIGLGDYVDAINHHDPRFNPLEISKEYGIRDLSDLPRCQCQHVAEKLKPIAGKCLGLLSGNHEDALRRYNTFDPTQYMAELLGTEALGGKAWFILRFQRKTPKNIVSETYRICAAHGTGGGGFREGYPINKAYDIFRWDTADFHVMGHLHRMSVDRAIFTSCDYGILRHIPSWFGVNGCMLSKQELGTDGYFEQKVGKESDIGMLKLTVSTNVHDKSKNKTLLENIYL